jgi:hypothetical protein
MDYGGIAMEDQRQGGFVDFLRFRVMVAPVVIQVLFWIGAVVSVIAGILTFVAASAMSQMFDGMGGDLGLRTGPFWESPGFTLRLAGIAYIIIGPLLLRVYAELLLVLFRIYDTLRDIRRNTQRAE